MINNPEENVALPADLQKRVETVRANTTLAEEALKLKVAARQAEEYTISQLLIQEEDLKGKIATLNELNEDAKKYNRTLTSENIDLEDEILKKKAELEAFLEEMNRKSVIMDAREKECLAREGIIMEKEVEFSKKEVKLNEDISKMSNFIEKLKVVTNELPR